MWYRTVLAQYKQEPIDENYQGVYNNGRLVELLPNVPGAVFQKREGDTVWYIANGALNLVNIPENVRNKYVFNEFNKLKEQTREFKSYQQVDADEKMFNNLYFEGVNLIKNLISQNPQATPEGILMEVAESFDRYTGGQLAQKDVDIMFNWYKQYLNENFQKLKENQSNKQPAFNQQVYDAKVTQTIADANMPVLNSPQMPQELAEAVKRGVPVGRRN